MLNSFSHDVRKAFKEHEIEDEKLETVIADLFDSFQNHLLSPRNDFVKEITKQQNEATKIRRDRNRQFR